MCKLLLGTLFKGALKLSIFDVQKAAAPPLGRIGLKKVSRMFQRSTKGISRKFQECSMKFQRNFKDVLRNFMGI